MIKIDNEKLKYITPFDINYNYLDFIFCKKDKDRYGEGYHPGRAMAIMMRINNDEIRNEIYKINSKFLLEKNNYMLFPYKFDFKLHNDKKNIIKSDWYSGLAQGLALMAYIRYGENIEIINKILNSFESPEILEKTNNGYHYMEYPNHCDALNGHIYALYGIYEYWLNYQTEQAEFLFNEGIKWVKHNLHHYRNEGNVSYYCLNHKVLCNGGGGKYHKVHIEQLGYLFLITGDLWFKKQSDLFMNDYKT